MLERLEALQALRGAGTMGRAAVVLRVTQSAVSKRIAALEAEVGATLVERVGRRVQLTPRAVRLLDEARPLLLGLRELMRETARADASVQTLRVAATDSLLASFLPAALRAAVDRESGLRLELHAHRGPLLLERVRGGDYELGLCPLAVADKQLVVRELCHEQMVIVPSRLEPVPLSGEIVIWAIERRSLTWEAIEMRIARLRKRAGFALTVGGRLESFTGLVQIARAGFGHALVPIGVARELGVQDRSLLTVPGLTRPIGAVGRASTLARPAVRGFIRALRDSLPR